MTVMYHHDRSRGMARHLRLAVLTLVAATLVSAQTRSPRSDLDRVSPGERQVSEDQQREAGLFFEKVIKHLSESSFGSLQSLLNQTVHVSIPGVAPGQYSANQASQLLTTYLSGRRVTAIERQRIESRVISPYLSARLKISKDGRSDSLSLYVSLVRSSGSLAIAHLSLY